MSAIDSVVIVYTNRDFNGNPIPLAEGEHDYYKIADQLKINDSIQSIKIPPGYTVTVWEHNRQGKTATFKADTPYVGEEFSSIISSVEVLYDKEEAARVAEEKRKEEERIAEKALFTVMKFNGASSFIETLKSPANGLSAFTFESWIKPYSLKEGLFFAQLQVLEFGIKLSKLFYSVAPTTSSDSVWGYVDASISIQRWHHVALVGDSTSASIYLDGNLVKTVGIKLQETYASSSHPFAIGAMCVGEPFYKVLYSFDGEMTEARVWNVAHKHADIQAGMNKRLSGKEPNLIAYYPLNEINLETISPRALNLVGGNHGTAKDVSVVYDDTLPLQKRL
jgi:hypothetical protein